MKLKKTLFVALGLAFAAGAAHAQLKVGITVSATGPAASLGIPERNTVELMPKEIGGQKVTYIVLDDASDTTSAVKNIRKLVSEDKVDVVLGSTTSPNSLGMIDVAAESQTPMIAWAASSRIVEPVDDKRRWVFKTPQNDSHMSTAIVSHMTSNNVKNVAFIGFADAYGEGWYEQFNAVAEARGIKIVANERFTRTDTSVTGQALKIIAAKPDAVLVTAPGGPSVLPETTLYDLGYKGHMYQTHGAALPGFLKLGGKKVEGTVLAASLMLVLGEIPDSNPSKKVASEYIAAYEKLNGEKPATFGANVYDAGLLLEKAIPLAEKKGKPGTPEFRAALRDALEQTHELVGTQGVYNMSPTDHSGFDDRGREMITVKDGTWRLLK